jgi:Tfp pilus assembly protein PilN
MSAKKTRLSINLDLLHPQSNPAGLSKKITRWLFTSGRFIFIIVEAIVLGAFLSRFFLDNNIANRKKAIDQLIPYIQSLKQYEIAVSNLQIKLAFLNSFFDKRADYTFLLNQISLKTPSGVRFSDLSLKKIDDVVKMDISASASNNGDLLALLSSIKRDPNFSNTTLSSIGFDGTEITFNISANFKKTKGI